VRLLLSALSSLALACAAKNTDSETSQPVGAEPVASGPMLFVEAPPNPPRETPEPSERPPVDERSAEAAKQLFQDGMQRYEQGDIAGAVEKFREAYALAPLPALLFNIARGQEQLGDIAGACETYKTMQTDPAADDAMRNRATEQIAHLNCP
jgi:TolA-binding protein